MSLKTKSFSRETEALILVGGGETHSELLIGQEWKNTFSFGLLSH